MDIIQIITVNTHMCIFLFSHRNSQVIVEQEGVNINVKNI